MTDNPQEPNSLDPELPHNGQPDQPPPADDLDELRKNISTQELIEKPEKSPSFFKRMTTPLTGAINRLRGTSSLDTTKPPKSGKPGAFPAEDIEDSLFDRVLPPAESLPGGETNPMLPEWTEEQSPPPDSDLTIPMGAPFDTTLDDLNPGLPPPVDMPFDTTLDEMDLETSGDSPNPEGKTWLFGREEEQDDLSDLEELLKPLDFETTGSGSSSEDTIDQDKASEIQKPHGWRSLITGMLGRPKPAETTDQPETNEMDDTVMSSRLGLSGPDQTAESALNEETLPGSEETLLDENQQFNIQPEETPWYEQRQDIILEEITEDEYQRFGFGMSLKYDAPEGGEAGTPTLTEDQEADEDIMRDLQADRSELVEGAEVAFQMPFDDEFGASLQEYKPDIQFEQDYDDENVAAYWGPSAVEEEEEEVEAEVPFETATLDDMRGVVLEEYDAVGADSTQSEVAPKPGWLGYLSRVEVIILTFLVVAILAVVAGLVLIQNGLLAGFQPSEPPIVATEQVFVPNGPYPTGIEITGGWYLPLNSSTVVEGKWLPKSAEWLTGSEIRRLVALPWNRQLEAVIISLVPGDTINLYFNNDKTIVYQVEKVERITASSTSQLQDLTPSLLVILAKEDSTDRWVLTCTPIDIP